MLSNAFESLATPRLGKERDLYAHCPLCAHPHFERLVQGDCSNHPLYHPALSKTIDWMQCTACRHVFTSGYFTEEACRIIFSNTNAGQKLGAQIENNRLISARMIEKVLPYQSDGGWLDVGFGNGSLLFTAQEYGFDAMGLDLRQDNVQKLQKLGVAAQCCNVTAMEGRDRFSVISMADVLEHIPYPREALQAAWRLLRPGGVLLVSMPNSENVLWQVMNQQGANPYWGELEHYHNFSRSRLNAFLSEHDFVPRRYGVSERYRVCMEVIASKPDACAPHS